MKNRLFVLLFALLGLGIGIGRISPLSTTSAAPAAETAHIVQHSSGVEGLHFTLHTPLWEQTAEGSLAIAGLTETVREPGAPALPYYTTLIALPPHAEATLAVKQHQTTGTTVATLLPVPDVDRAALPEDVLEVRRLEDYGLVYDPDPAIYANDAFYPETAWQLSEPMVMRDLRVVALTLYPLQYNPVSGTLAHTPAIEISLTFSGADFNDLQPAPVFGGVPFGTDLVLNSAQADGWRSLPTGVEAFSSPFPVGRDVYAIEVDRDGIHTVTYEQLQAAGMNVAGINPNTFQLIHGGNVVPFNPDNPATWEYNYEVRQVAWELVGNSNNQFEPGEAIRFYAWKWDGNRHDKHFVLQNAYYLWAGGTPTRITTATNPTGNNVADYWTSTVTFEQDRAFHGTDTNKWPTFENQADTWYWDRFNHREAGNVITRTYTLNLPDPVTTGPDGEVRVEIFTPYNLNGHRLFGRFNQNPSFNRLWNGVNSVNLVQGIPAATLQNGNNSVDLWGGSTTSINDQYWLNRITVTYPRLFRAVNNQLIFDHRSGAHEFRVGGFNTGTATDYHVWDITDRFRPKRVPVASADLSGSGSNRTVRIGSNQSGHSRHIAATTTHAPVGIYRHTIVNLDPPGNGADWVLIVHPEFLPEAERLAAHRATHSGMVTHIVRYDYLRTQYGFGNGVRGIKHYMARAMTDWSRKPTYLVLGGDATWNPWQRPCPLCNNPDAMVADRTFVPTDLVFEDRFAGLIPSDHTFTTVLGNDLLPDLAVGRLTANSLAEMKNIVDKTIRFDQEVRAGSPWTKRQLYLADDADAGGNFCQINEQIMHTNQVRAGYAAGTAPDPLFAELCLDTYLAADPNMQNALAAMRADFMARLANPDRSPLMVNYRGHGSIQGWAGGLLNVAPQQHHNDMNNIGRPLFILSADCLDGFFARSGMPALSETILRMPNEAGSAAHWSSSGLGFTYEHTKLHSEFYNAVYDLGHTSLGSATMYAKTAYYNATNPSYHESELYSFILQGDPALTLVQTRPVTYGIFLPLVVR